MMLTSAIKERAFIIEHFLNGNYKQFQTCLDQIQSDLRFDPIVGSHTSMGKSIFREIRLKALKQFIQAFKVISLQEVATEFSKSMDQIESDLVHLISNGALEYKINCSTKTVHKKNTN